MGFEPTLPEEPVPKTGAINHSATLPDCFHHRALTKYTFEPKLKVGKEDIAENFRKALLRRKPWHDRLFSYFQFWFKYVFCQISE